MSFWSGVLAIVRKDLSMELRGKEIVTTSFFFALLTLVIFNFAFDMSSLEIRKSAAGILWVALLFAGALTMNRSFLYEKENDCLSALMLAPLDRSSIYFGKLISNLALMLISEVFIIPIFIVLFNINVMQKPLYQLAALLLGTTGFITVGTIIAAMSVNLRAREMLGPLLMLPVVAPVVIAAVEASGGMIRGEPAEGWWVWLEILIAFDVIYLVVSWLVFEKIIEE